MLAVDASLPKRSRFGQGANFLVSLRNRLNRIVKHPIRHAGEEESARQKLRDGIALRIALGLYGPEDRRHTDPFPSDAELANGRQRAYRLQASHANRVRLAEARAALLAQAAIADVQTPANIAAEERARAAALTGRAAPAASTGVRERLIVDDADDDEEEEVFGSDDDDDDDGISALSPGGASSTPSAPQHAALFVPESPVCDGAATATATASTHPIFSPMPMAHAFVIPSTSMTLPSLPPNPPDISRDMNLEYLIDQLPPDHPAVAVIKEPLTVAGNMGLESQEQRLLDQVSNAILEGVGLKRQRNKLVSIVAMQYNTQGALELANADLQQELVEVEEQHANKVQRVRDAAREEAANESRSALNEAQRVAERLSEDAETLRRRITELEGELNAEKGRSNHLRCDLYELKESSCCQMCGDSIEKMLNIDTGTVDSKLAVCTGGPRKHQHLMCAMCLNQIYNARLHEGNLTNLRCVHCPDGGVFDLERHLDLMSPGVVATYHEVRVNKEVAKRTAAVEAAAAANGGGPTTTLSDEELTSLPPVVQAELRRARAAQHALADARTVKAPCCGRPVVDFDGCVAIDCKCGKSFCGLCFQVHSGFDENHAHVLRKVEERVTDDNRHNLPVLEGTYDYDRLPEAQRPCMPTELEVCPCHPHSRGTDPFFFTSTQQRAYVKKCWEARVLSQMYPGHEMEDPQPIQ
jgi:hypothetical protein